MYANYLHLIPKGGSLVISKKFWLLHRLDEEKDEEHINPPGKVYQKEE